MIITTTDLIITDDFKILLGIIPYQTIKDDKELHVPHTRKNTAKPIKNKKHPQHDAENYFNLLYFALIQIWYQEWFMPACEDICHIPSSNTVNQNLQYLKIVGETALAIKLIKNIFFTLPRQLKKTTHTDIHGNQITSRQLGDAFFTLADTGLSIASGISYFILAASWTSPVFIANSAVLLASSLYSLQKTLCEFNQFVASTPISLIHALFGNIHFGNTQNAKINRLKCQYFRERLKKDSFNILTASACLAFTALWFTNPVTAIIGLVSIGLIWWYGNKKCDKAIQQKKQSVLNQTALFKQKKAPLTKPSPLLKSQLLLI